MCVTRLVIAALALVISSVCASSAQPGNRYLDMESRVLDGMFPLDVQSKPYKWKMVLRYTDSAAQLTLVAYTDLRVEVIERRVADMDNGGLAKLVTKMMEQKTPASERRIAAQLKVNTLRATIDAESATRTGGQNLRGCRVHADLGRDRISLDSHGQR